MYKWILRRWPLMWRSTHERVRRENVELRNALRITGAELRKHRLILADIRDGDFSVADRILRAPRRSPEA